MNKGLVQVSTRLSSRYSQKAGEKGTRIDDLMAKDKMPQNYSHFVRQL